MILFVSEQIEAYMAIGCVQTCMQDRPPVHAPETGSWPASLTGRSVFVRSFGCALNQADSLRMEAWIRACGGVITAEDRADVVVVNTCTVVGRTEREVLRFLRRNNDKELYVMGCMATLQEQEILKVCRAEWVPPISLDTPAVPLGVRINEAIGLIPIARGCQGECTYCIARKARGALHSEPAGRILRAVRDLTKGGVREIQLTAQDVAAWGQDLDQNLPSLLRSILSLPGRFHLRLGMMNPATLMPLVDELLPLFKHPKMYACAHLPVQSGADPILSRMGRRYQARDFLDLVQVLRERVPQIWIATDVIVGFPGESEDEFEHTLDLIRTVRPNKVNITRFSPRPGTAGASFPDILERTKKERSRRLSRLADQICSEINHSWLEKEVQVFVVEHIKAGTAVCRTPEYRSVVIPEELPLGSEVRVRITGARTHYLTGVRIPTSDNTPL